VLETETNFWVAAANLLWLWKMVIAWNVKLKTTKTTGDTGKRVSRKGLRDDQLVKPTATRLPVMEPVVRHKTVPRPSAKYNDVALRLAAAEARIAELESALREADKYAFRDPLTGTFNRRGLNDVFAREAARARRTGQPLTLALIDLDDFKHVNDQHGHAVGDAALVHLTRVISETLRPTDLCGRWGGEEFVVVMPGADRLFAKRALARVQTAMAAQAIASTSVILAFSAGVVLGQSNESLEHMVVRADHALYRAKAAGKRRIFSG
jgi:diguanylate cyclase (GGDEF)-like protein